MISLNVKINFVFFGMLWVCAKKASVEINEHMFCKAY